MKTWVHQKMRMPFGWIAIVVGSVGLNLSGCRPERIVQFEPNMVFAKAAEIDVGYPMDQALNETQDAVTKMFGTPDNPKLPEFALESDYAELITLEQLKAVAGASSNHIGLYAKHCANCHGVTGNGRGPTAALLPLYPRDYRAGKFKFKNTRRGQKPLREDLFASIKHGINGTSMKSIQELAGPAVKVSDEDIENLVSYVIYLSWRGELERGMIKSGEDIAFEDGESLFQVKLESSEPEKYQQQWEAASELAQEIGESWLNAVDSVKAIPDRPANVPVPETIEEVVAAANSAEDTPLKQSIERGKELFASEKAACGKCHGKQGYGDGQTQDYDDWTKEWTTRVGIEPTDEAAQIPLIARGALPPRKILPRDFREGYFHGGSSPENIYRRISEGIEGTPMPAATALSADEIWDLVNFARSLKSRTLEK